MKRQTKTEKGAVNKLLSHLLTVLCTVLLAAALLLTVYAFYCRSAGKTPFLFGRAMLFVQTESMEPTIARQSCIFVKKADPSAVKAGDIITYVCRDETSPVYGALITHRVVGVTEEGFRTKGDHPAAAEDRLAVAPEDVVAVYVKNAALMTLLARTFSGPMGLILAFGVFGLSIGVIVIRDVVRVLSDDGMSEEERKAAHEKEIEKRIREETERLYRENK